MATYTVTLNERTAFGKGLVNFLSTLQEIKFEKVTDKKPEKPKKNALDRADDDIKAGRVYKAKNGRDLVEKCLK